MRDEPDGALSNRSDDGLHADGRYAPGNGEVVSLTVDDGLLQAWVAEAASRLEVPGVAVGVLHNGREDYAFHGVEDVGLTEGEGCLFSR